MPVEFLVKNVVFAEHILNNAEILSECISSGRCKIPDFLTLAFLLAERLSGER